MRNQLTLAVALIASMVVGCGARASQNDTPDATESAGQSSAASAAAAAPSSVPEPVDPCTGISSCREVATVDVDGDGVPDRLGLSVVRQPPQSPQVAYGGAVITVAVATGDKVHRIDVDSSGNLPGYGGDPQPFVGAFLISRKAGADLVLHTEIGAGNAERFAVIGWQDGRPMRVNRPPYNANTASVEVWFISSSHGVREWVTCSDGAAVTITTLSAAVREGVPVPGGGTRKEQRFAYDSGAWSPASSETIADDNFTYHFDPHTETFQCEDKSTRAVVTPSGSSPDAPVPPTCDSAAISRDLGQQLYVERCYQDWAYVSTGELGDAQSLLRLVGGTWTRYAGFPSNICRAQASADGVPSEELSSFGTC